jgi:hypothetical protein
MKSVAKKTIKPAVTGNSPILGKAVFALEKETPGAVKYQEVDANGAKLKEGYLIGSLYLRKDKLNGNVPQVLKVTVEA